MSTGWSSEALTLLDRACRAHGGPECYESLSSLSLVPSRLDGRLLARRGLRRTFPMPSRADVFPHERQVILPDYPEAGYDGIFDKGDVWIQSREDGTVAVESYGHRDVIGAWPRPRRWSALDAIYFLGSLFWFDLVLPFALTETRLVRLRSTRGARPLTLVDVELPGDWPAPCDRCTVYFDWKGRLVRIDYRADVGGWASWSQAFDKYIRVDGLAVATDIRIASRVGFVTITPSLVHLGIGTVEGYRA